MSNVVGAIHSSLKNLYDLLLIRGYVQHPQIMFMAIGDSVITSGRMCDEVPLQVGQFESDLRATLQLENMVIEGGGGGQKSESYQNAAYFLAEHTVHDAWERRRKKGYVYVIGDVNPDILVIDDEPRIAELARRLADQTVGPSETTTLETSEIALVERGGRIFYPVFEKRERPLLKEFVAIPKQTTAFFLFQGDAPLELHEQLVHGHQRVVRQHLLLLGAGGGVGHARLMLVEDALRQAVQQLAGAEVALEAVGRDQRLL